MGYVFWAKSTKIDKTDKKPRRRYVVVRDSGNYVSVSKIRGCGDNKKNVDRLYKLNSDKYPLLKESGVDYKVYGRRSDNNKRLSLSDRDVFDSSEDFKLTSHDTHRVLVHTGQTGKKDTQRKKGRKK